MSFLHFGICDDFAADRQLLRDMLDAYMAQKTIAAQIDSFANAQALLNAFSPGAFQTIFLDIYMPGINGMRAAESIRAADPDVFLVFTTTSADHAIESYAIHAAGYLLKPYTSSQLAETMDWCFENFKSRAQALEVTSNRETVSVSLKDILYIEVYGRSSLIHTPNNTVTTNRSLSEIELALSDSFLRCHRSYIVNMEHILKPDGSSFVLTGKHSVPIARDSANQVKQTFFDWSFRRTWESR